MLTHLFRLFDTNFIWKKKKEKKQAVLEGSTKNLKIFGSYDREIADLTN